LRNIASVSKPASSRSGGSQRITLKLGGSFPYLFHVSSVTHEVP
jgi:hypothetical protein